MKFIDKHKTVLIVSLICLILLVLASLAVYRMFYPSGDKSIYGDRLQDAPEVEANIIEEIKTEITNSGLVNEISYTKNVRVIKFIIDVKENAKVMDAEGLSKIILNKLTTKVTTYYDIEIYLTQKNGEDTNYPAIGYHSKNAEYFSWVTNKEEVKNEE